MLDTFEHLLTLPMSDRFWTCWAYVQTCLDLLDTFGHLGYILETRFWTCLDMLESVDIVLDMSDTFRAVLVMFEDV